MKIPDTFDNSRRFIFSNWTDEDFTCSWGGTPIVVKVGETREFEMALAYHLTKHLVNREIMKDGKANFMDSEEERAPYEEKTIAEIGAGTDSPALATLKAKIAEEVKEVEEKKSKGKKKEVKEEEVEKVKEFEDIA